MLGSQMPQIALVGSDYYRLFARNVGFSESDLLRQALAERGFSLRVVDAYDPSVRWTDFAAVLPLGFWGYHRDLHAFARWIDGLVEQGVRLINPPPVLRWNMDKSYLLDLQRAGVEVAAFLHFPAGSRPDLAAELAQAGWERYVLKPTVSANAENTRVGSGPPDAELRALAAAILARCGLLVQPFFPEIPQDGEWSLLVAGDRLTHAVKKRPRAGDFRSQPDHGGTVLRVTPGAELTAQTLEVVRLASALRAPLTYARVDGFIRGGRLQLIELELIEPYLFLQGEDAQVTRQFVDALIQSLAQPAIHTLKDAPGGIGDMS